MNVNEWRNKSLNGEVCAVVGCINKPSIKCEICGISYCKIHSVNHFHRLKK